MLTFCLIATRNIRLCRNYLFYTHSIYCKPYIILTLLTILQWSSYIFPGLRIRLPTPPHRVLPHIRVRHGEDSHTQLQGLEVQQQGVGVRVLPHIGHLRLRVR